ncbi:DNA polymerase III subunit gamma/tau [Limoniibacter endophyticus]|uniref:DNA polymerase III subunit gamma/tau n=1 Tax=Limoniibacter endophyticus TaxID=1565040 RepID=A0A8J3DFU7_9HYPH|nr:DNA polymerase III subunit gamma/tau [Limoniibacter endophyticus]
MADDQKKPGYRVLARKYRPSDFTGLIGQEPMVRTLTNAFAAGRIAQAWMLTGVRGVGKTTTARILARALNYRTDKVDQPSIDLSVEGEHCRAIMEGRHVDVVEMDAASHTGIDDIREIIEQVRYAPVSARYKVYIIDEVHMLSTQAFNGLLKTLEEPPAHVKFIFATTEIRKVPITVLSRCQRFDLRRIDAAELVAHMRSIATKEAIEVEDEALAMIARAGEGSARDSLSIFDQAIAHSAGNVTAEAVRAMLGLADRARIVDLFDHVMKGDVTAALDEFAAQYKAGADPATVLTDLADFTHLVTRLRFVPNAREDMSLSEDERRRGTEFATTLSVKVLSRAWQMLLKGIGEVESATRPYAAGEMVLIRLAHAADLPPLDEVIKGLQDSATSGGNGGTYSGGPSGGGAVAQAQAGGGRPRMMAQPSQQNAPAMRLVQSNPRFERVPEPEVADVGLQIRSLADMVELAGQNRDVQFKSQLKLYVRPVRVEPGLLEASFTEDAPKTLAAEITAKLHLYTKRRWVVSVSTEQGGATIAEQENEKRELVFEDARSDPTVAAILAKFPGAKVLDVRLAAEAEVDEENDEMITPEGVQNGIDLDEDDLF